MEVLKPDPVAVRSPDDPYRRFFNRMVMLGQDAFLEGRSIDSGADFAGEVGDLLREFLSEELPAAGQPAPLFVAFGPGGYWSEDVTDFVDDLASATVAHNPDYFANHDSAIVVGLSLPCIESCASDGSLDLGELQSAADDAIERGRKYGFTISRENAAEVMREELQWSGPDGESLSVAFDEVLVKVMLDQLDRPSPTVRDVQP